MNGAPLPSQRSTYLRRRILCCSSFDIHHTHPSIECSGSTSELAISPMNQSLQEKKARKKTDANKLPSVKHVYLAAK